MLYKPSTHDWWYHHQSPCGCLFLIKAGGELWIYGKQLTQHETNDNYSFSSPSLAFVCLSNDKLAMLSEHLGIYMGLLKKMVSLFINKLGMAKSSYLSSHTQAQQGSHVLAQTKKIPIHIPI